VNEVQNFLLDSNPVNHWLNINTNSSYVMRPQCHVQ